MYAAVNRERANMYEYNPNTLTLVFHTKLKIVECVCGEMVSAEHLCDIDIKKYVFLNYILCQGDKCQKCTDENLLSIVDSSSVFTVKSDTCADDVLLQDCLVITLHQKLKLTETPNSDDSFFYQNPYLNKKSYDLCKITQYKRLAYILCPIDTCEICKDFCEAKEVDAYWIKAKGLDEEGYMNEGGPCVTCYCVGNYQIAPRCESVCICGFRIDIYGQ